jgi:hypothetical protein
MHIKICAWRLSFCLSTINESTDCTNGGHVEDAVVDSPSRTSSIIAEDNLRSAGSLKIVRQRDILNLCFKKWVKRYFYFG